jgi:uncharacterized membrane protein
MSLATQSHPIRMSLFSASHDEVLFEALCTPPATLGGRGLVVLGGAFTIGSMLIGLLFFALGAWPVLGFAVGVVLLVLTMLHLYRRHARRAMELVILTEGGLTIRRRDDKGRPQEIRLDPYWARLRFEPRDGRVSALSLHQRGRTVEIGAMLSEDEKRDLAEALDGALRRYREPVFDNPQLR